MKIIKFQLKKANLYIVTDYGYKLRLGLRIADAFTDCIYNYELRLRIKDVTNII